MGNGFLCDFAGICPAQVAPASAPMVGATDKTTTRKLTKEEAAKMSHCYIDLSNASRITIQEPQQNFLDKTYLMKVEHEPTSKEYATSDTKVKAQTTDYCAVTKRAGHDFDLWQLSKVATSSKTTPFQDMTSSQISTGGVIVQKVTRGPGEVTRIFMELTDKYPDIKLEPKPETTTAYTYYESSARDSTPSNQAKYEEVQKTIPHFEGDKLIMEKREVW